MHISNLLVICKYRSSCIAYRGLRADFRSCLFFKSFRLCDHVVRLRLEELIGYVWADTYRGTLTDSYGKELSFSGMQQQSVHRLAGGLGNNHHNWLSALNLEMTG